MNRLAYMQTGLTEQEKDKLIAQLIEYLKLMHDSSSGVHGTYDEDFQKDCMVCLLIAKAEGRLS